ncbi:Agc/akt protein kinase, partial [Globisporangium splendens]
MGAELSKSAPGDAASSSNGMRRVGSSGALDKKKTAADLPTSSSTTSLVTMGLNSAPAENTPAAGNGSLVSSYNGSSDDFHRNSVHNSSNNSNPGGQKSLFSSIRRSSNSRVGGTNSPDAGTPLSGGHEGDHAVESLDLPIVEWEGYVTKRGHLVRNWKNRFFTLEGTNLSYYESKVDARNRSHLKGRVQVASVKLEKTSKSGHGFDFSFETSEGKVFHCSVPTKLDQLTWVYFLEAGVDCSNMRKNSKPIYNTYRHGTLPDMKTEKAYDIYRRLMGGEMELVNELMSYFNKDVLVLADLVFTSSYPKSTPFSGDYFGREGFLHFLGAFYNNVEVVEFTVNDIVRDSDGKSYTIKGHEKLKSKHSGTVIFQPWTHKIRFGPYGRILRLRADVDIKMANGNWKQFGVKNPYSEISDAAFRSTRSLSISMKDFTVYNVIGKGGFGTVVNAVKKSDGQIYALKILEKGKMTKYDIESSFTEMRVAQNIHHPFIAGLRIAFQSRTKLFLGMNYYGGGDLFHHMSKGASCRIPADRAHFYTAELVLGIHHLHQHDILYRDIKPENVMIDAEGHIALVDFGLAKLHVSNYNGAKTMAGSPQYTAPELLLPKAKRSYGKAADWWSLGILLYEMSVGKSPFYDNNIEKMYSKIQNDPLTFPEKPDLPDDLKDILRGFLQKDATKRLGSNISDILHHPYFSQIDWDLLLQKKTTPPWKPTLQSPLDVEYVDAEFTELDVNREVQSPTDKSASRSKGIFSLVSSRTGRKTTPPVQDPTFKDFTYFCEDPDALVEVNDLVSELRPPPPPPCDLDSDERDSEESNKSEEGNKEDPSGTPLSSFVDHGFVHKKSSLAEDEFRAEMKKLESSMAEQFERVEVTISRGRPAHLQGASASADQSPATSHHEEHAEVPVSTPTASNISVTPSEHKRSQNSRQGSSGSSTDGPLMMD